MAATIHHILPGWSWMWALGLLPTSNWCKHYVVWAHSMVLRHIHMINSTAVYIESLIMEYRKIFLCEMFTFQGMLSFYWSLQDFSFNLKRLYFILFWTDHGKLCHFLNWWEVDIGKVCPICCDWTVCTHCDMVSGILEPCWLTALISRIIKKVTALHN